MYMNFNMSNNWPDNEIQEYKIYAQSASNKVQDSGN